MGIDCRTLLGDTELIQNMIFYKIDLNYCFDTKYNFQLCIIMYICDKNA